MQGVEVLCRVYRVYIPGPSKHLETCVAWLLLRVLDQHCAYFWGPGRVYKLPVSVPSPCHH